jgi:membrane protein DedA with SNARE-associated domain/membrane-associated phospholipid phosphatase
MSGMQIAALALAAGLIAYGALKRRHLGLVAAGALALIVYGTGVLSQLPDPEKVIEDVAKALGEWTYALVAVLAFLETGAFVGLIAPGEFTVILGGVIAGQGEIDIIPLVGLVWFAAFLGDTTSFFIGRRLGREFLMKHGPRVKITHERLRQVEDYFQRHGGKTILVGRFIGLVRALAPFIAGTSNMPYGRFAPYSVLGTGLWAATFSLLGFIFYRSFSQVAEIAGRATVAFGFVVGTIVLIVWAYRRLKEEEQRRKVAEWLERQAQKPLLRPLALLVRPIWRYVLRPAYRVVAPQARFLSKRLTPGKLGIEFTTSIAIAAVGLYVFAGYAYILADDPSLTPADERSLEMARDLWTSWGLDLAKVVTELGSTPVVLGWIAIACILLGLRRRPAEIIALLVGFICIWAVVQLTKAGIDRERPLTQQIATDSASYPSGHAAYSTVYVALAVIAARVLPGIVSRAALVLIAVLVAVAIGLTRIYLHAHYWSDVAGGWGLGAGVFGLVGAVTLLVLHLRQTRPAVRRPATAADRG